VTPERWQQVRAALHEALELDLESRSAFLAAIGANDGDLRGEVESLIAAHDGAGDTFMSSPPAADTRLGRRVGPYQLVEEIGSGGMGEVYRATRIDDEYQKQVAIKLVRIGQDSAFVVDRFKNERQILASFEHTNIARLLDGGTTVDGLPYFVMELVVGEPIDQYCNRHKLDTTARLRLFLQVCAAVQYAHQRLIVHRDLKPNNILVGADGAPKLLDFGIAKILEPGEISATPHHATVFRLLTPSYASPEQIKGEPITTACDVYSLGVVLYELLTGYRPDGTTGSTPSPVSPTVGGVDPKKPSSVVRRAETWPRAAAAVAHSTSETVSALRDGSPQKLSRRLRGDLDNIVLMALRTNPARRYDSVERFAQDIHRHLEHLPVIARTPTLGYRARSFIVRYRIAVAAAALIALALLGGIIMTERQVRIAQNALSRARDESRASNQAMDYLASLFDAASPDKTGGKTIEPRTLIDQGQGQIDAHFADRPLMRARMLAAVGSLYCKIGLTEQCSRDIEQALAIQKANPGSDPLVLAQFQYRLANAYNSAGRADEAIALLNGALPVFQAQRPRDDRETAAALYEFGQAHIANHQPAEAIAVLEQARTLLSDGRGNDTLDSADTLGALAIAYGEKSLWSDAATLAASRVALVGRSLGTDHVRYFDALNDDAEVASQAGHYDVAEQDWRQVIDGYVRVFGRTSAKSIDAELSLADALFRRDRLRESIEWFQRAVDDSRLAGALDRAQYQGALGGLSQVLWQYGDYSSAEAAAHEAHQVSQRMHGPTPSDAAVSAFRWGHLLAFVGEARRAVELLEPDMPGDPQVLQIRRYQGLRLFWLGDCYREMGDDTLAAQTYDQAIELYQSLKQPQSVTMNMAYEAKGLLRVRERRFAEAVPLLRLAIAGYGSTQFVPDGPAIAAAKVELAGSLLELGQGAEAQSLIAEAGAIVDRELAPTHRARIMLARLRARTRT
jgi:eukaryotic-like serine/threonine-protein kinase